ncbi:MAG TPA: hypothetical protein VEJ63_17475 [Planctomycetota bacterium]|nr:hypothetical protein [Planctomycetota bacterium]
MAAAAGEPYAVFYCTELQYRLAGEGPDAWDAYRKEHDGRVPEKTVFESAELVGCFATERLKTLVKVANTKENAELFQKESVTPGTLVFYAPDGEKLASFSGQELTAAKLHAYIHDGFRNKVAQWKEKASHKPVKAK